MMVSAALGRDVVVGLVHVLVATHTPFRAGPARGLLVSMMVSCGVLRFLGLALNGFSCGITGAVTLLECRHSRAAWFTAAWGSCWTL